MCYIAGFCLRFNRSWLFRSGFEYLFGVLFFGEFFLSDRCGICIRVSDANSSNENFIDCGSFDL